MANNTNSNKQLESTKAYMDALSKKHSKLNIVRVDLGYKKPHSENATLEEANKDFNHMLNNMRSKPSIFDGKVGYVCKREYTEDKGVHIHALIIFDGHKVKNSSLKADEIGEYWEKTTEQKGNCHNCHRNTYEYTGIGILDRRDCGKRKILYENVIPYLCKNEQNIEPLKKTSKDRAFTRGTITKSKRNIGSTRMAL